MLVVLLMFLYLDISTELRGTGPKPSQTREGNRVHGNCLLAIFMKVKGFYFAAVKMIIKSWQEMVWKLGTAFSIMRLKDPSVVGSGGEVECPHSAEVGPLHGCSHVET